MKQESSSIEKAEKQLALQLIAAEKANRIPRTLTAEGEMHWTNPKFDWTEVFFPTIDFF